jgi:hypothetical protein
MDTTDCLGLPFPECEPPLVKDASDIIQFKALADATDAAVQAYSDSLTSNLISPPMVLMQGSLNSAGQDVVQFFNGTVAFDTAAMADTINDMIRIPENGWYMFGFFVHLDNAVTFNVRAEPLLNGDPFSARQGPSSWVPPSGVGGVNEQLMGADCAFFNEGDLLNFMTHHTDNPATLHNYVNCMWALQVMASV